MANNKKVIINPHVGLPSFAVKKKKKKLAGGGALSGDLFGAAGDISSSIADTFIPEEDDRLSNPGKRAITGGLSMAGQGAKLGSMFGPIGTGVGAGVGLLAGTVLGAAGGKQEQQAKFDALKEKHYADGGLLNPFTYANGGPMGGDIEEINGPTHEEGGVAMGEGNEVEGGEVKVDDYIFSDRLGMPDSKTTFADEAKKIKKKYELRDDSITMDSQKAELTKLMEANESMRIAKEAEEAEKEAAVQQETEKLALGGPLDGGGRKERRQARNNAEDFTDQDTFGIEGAGGLPSNFKGKSYHHNAGLGADKEYSRTAGDFIHDIFNKEARIKTTFADGGELGDGDPLKQFLVDRPDLVGMPEDTIMQVFNKVNGINPAAENVQYNQSQTQLGAKMPTFIDSDLAKEYGATDPRGIQKAQAKSGYITPQGGKQTLDKSGLPAMPDPTSLLGGTDKSKDPTKFQFGNEEKAMLASSLPALDNMLKGMKPEVTKFDRVTPETISLQPQRDASERQAAIARAIQRENVRGNAKSSGQALSALSSGNSALTENLTGNLMQSYMSEENANAQIRNQANQANTQISQQETIANEQNRAMAATLKNMGLSNISTNYQGYLKDKKMGSENIRQNKRIMSMINATFPNYNWEEDNGAFATAFASQLGNTSTNAYGGYTLPKM